MTNRSHGLALFEILSTSVLLALFCSTAQTQQKPGNGRASDRTTFNRDVAPILFHSCAPCHHSGEAGPFPLMTYGDAKSHARQIADLTSKRLMPPWLPSQEGVPLQEDAHLRPDQIATFQKWVADGVMEGNVVDLPETPKFSSDWQLGQPDLILKAAKPFTIPSTGSDVYWNFIFREPVNASRFVKAIEIHPGDKRLVHHANLMVDRTQSARHEEKSPGAGFSGMELQIESEAFDPDGHFLFWKPGSPPIVEPAGMALRLDPGNDFVLNTHLQPSGKTESLQPTIGVYFTNDVATKFPVLLQLDNDRAVHIPPGEKSFVVSDEFKLPEDVQLLAVYPHAHYLCREMTAVARFPNGSEEILLHIPRWDLNWQAVFRLVSPEMLPRGTTIAMRYIYDNSDENKANPNSPPQRVVAGNRAVDEMAHLWLQVLPVAAVTSEHDPRMVLQEALARHHIENNPADFEAHYNLGAMLQARNAVQDAVDQYQAALALRSGDATVENALGGALLALRRLPEAIAHLQAATAARPDYFDAHYNLGLAQAQTENFAAAVHEFELAAKIRPNDSDAEANFGAALAEVGDTKSAIEHFRRALQLDPNNMLAKQNLDALQGSGRP